MHKLNVSELFAGVGGFRLGLEATNKKMFNVNWANQWEPGRKVQHAFDCYNSRFKTGTHINEDISKLSDDEMASAKADMVVGGFPCQDYSVARSLNGELGIQGKKGVLFWEIARFIQNNIPKYVLLENVDRLLKSPSSQRGRDFAVMLGTFNELGYDVEWRVINAADYGNAQKRRRVFIFAYRRNMTYATDLRKKSNDEIIFYEGLFAKAFPIEDTPNKDRRVESFLSNDIVNISDNFSLKFWNSGVMRDGNLTTIDITPIFETATTLEEIIEHEYDEKYLLNEAQIEKFNYLRGSKQIERVSADGHKYMYNEGGMSPTDSLELPGRTMLTSEGTVNRSTHIVEVDGAKRFITPVEAERLNGFPDEWTSGMLDRTRYFCMGNALVVPIITRIGNQIEMIDSLNKVRYSQIEIL